MRVEAGVIPYSYPETTLFFLKLRKHFQPKSNHEAPILYLCWPHGYSPCQLRSLAVAVVEAARSTDEDVPTIFGYVGYKEKRNAEEDVPTIFGYLGYKKE